MSTPQVLSQLMPKKISDTSGHQSSTPMTALDRQLGKMASYLCFQVILGLDGTVVELQAGTDNRSTIPRS